MLGLILRILQADKRDTIIDFDLRALTRAALSVIRSCDNITLVFRRLRSSTKCYAVGTRE